MKLQYIPWGYHYNIKTMWKLCHITFIWTILPHTHKDEPFQYTCTVRPLSNEENKKTAQIH